MKRLIILATLAASPAFARAQHTVSWYQANPSAMYRALAACDDDPGDAKNTPDCENALAASITVAPWIEPTDERYWLIHSDQLPWELAACEPPVGRECDAALSADRQIAAARQAKRIVVP
jgi:hypothetical protein